MGEIPRQEEDDAIFDPDAQKENTLQARDVERLSATELQKEVAQLQGAEYQTVVLKLMRRSGDNKDMLDAMNNFVRVLGKRVDVGNPENPIPAGDTKQLVEQLNEGSKELFFPQSLKNTKRTKETRVKMLKEAEPDIEAPDPEMIEMEKTNLLTRRDIEKSEASELEREVSELGAAQYETVLLKMMKRTNNNPELIGSLNSFLRTLEHRADTHGNVRGESDSSIPKGDIKELTEELDKMSDEMFYPQSATMPSKHHKGNKRK